MILKTFGSVRVRLVSESLVVKHEKTIHGVSDPQQCFVSITSTQEGFRRGAKRNVLMYSRIAHMNFRFFCSLKLTVVVLLFLSISCFAGMFWDQTLTLDEHLINVHGSFWLGIYTFFEFNDVFHSWWFGFLVLFLALNLTACSIDRLPKIWIDIQYPMKILDDRLIKRIQLKCKFLGQKEEFNPFIQKIFRSNCISSTGDDNYFFYREKHKFGRLGVYVVHFALLMIMFGSIIATNFGIDGFVSIEEGALINSLQARGAGGLRYLHDLGFSVHCSDFRLRSFVDGTPLEFESDLEIWQNGAKEPVLRKTVRVNDPLQYNGYTFYQASYQRIPGEEKVNLRISPHGQDSREVISRIGESIAANDETIFVPLEIFENYGGLGEALKIQKISKNSDITSFLVFRKYPEFDKFVRRGDWDVVYAGSDARYKTGISVGKFPWLGVVLLGSVLLLLGIILAFGFTHRRYYARIRRLSNDTRCEITFAMWGKRHRERIKDEFDILTQMISQKGVQILDKNGAGYGQC